MLIVNLYGAPGAGKSTGAAYVFSQLKMRGINAELVTEFAKDKVWEESKAVFDNQLYIFAKQYFRISRLHGKVDVVVTDSPLLLSSYYGDEDKALGNEFKDLVYKVSSRYKSYDAFIDRAKPYNPVGRFQNEEESDEISQELKEFLRERHIYPKHYPGDTKGYDELVDDVFVTLCLIEEGVE